MGHLGVFTSHCQVCLMFTEFFSSSPHPLSTSRSLYDVRTIADLVCEWT